MQKIFILGSCVTRDPFELAIKKYDITYLARTSFASAFQKQKVYNIDISNIPSAFQRKMVENDLAKNTESLITSTKPDWLLIDFIDERFNLFSSNNGEIFTLSPELTNNCSHNKEGEVILSNSDEFFELWATGWDKFIEIAKNNNLLDKIIINKVFWTNKNNKNGNVVPHKYENWIDENNKWLNKLYQYIEKQSNVKIIEYPESLLISDHNHKWGMQPYHYIAESQLYFLEKLELLEAYKKEVLNNTINVNLLPISLSYPSIKRGNSEKYQPIRFIADTKKDNTIILELTLASNDSVSNRDLLHSICYHNLDDEYIYNKQGYILSDIQDIGYYKYINTKQSLVYKELITINIPKNSELTFSIQDFYPKGKSVILEAKIRKI